MEKTFEDRVKEKLKEGWTVTQIARFLACSDMKVTRCKLRLERRIELGISPRGVQD